MNRQKIIEKVAAGLRRMVTPPTGLVFIDNSDYGWDDETICGLPVYHVSDIITFRPWGDEDCPFLPFWKQCDENAFHDWQQAKRHP